MARPRTFDEADVLDRAVQVFWSRGFEGTSIADLEEATGLGRQSLYNAFGDKRHLFLAALEHYRRQGESQRGSIAGRGLGAVETFFSSSIDFLTEGGERRGCFLTKARMEDSGTAGVPAVCTSNEESIRALFTRRLEEAREDGELRTGVSPEVAGRMLATWAHGLSAAAAAGAGASLLREEARLLISGLRTQEVPTS